MIDSLSFFSRFPQDYFGDFDAENEGLSRLQVNGQPERERVNNGPP